MNGSQDIKRKEVDRWSRNADAWNAWADRMADLADQVNQPFLAHLGVGEGMRVLDLASGAGEPALSAARLVGPTGRVVATDLVEEMLSGVRNRTAAEGLDDRLETKVADMETLPFEDGEFDVVCCRFGIMFAPDPSRAAAEALRVLRPGGAAGWTVFGPRAENTLLGAVFSAAFETLTAEQRGGVYTPFRFSELGENDSPLATILEKAGFSDVQDIPIVAQRVIPAIDRTGIPVWRQPMDMMCGGALNALTDEIRAEFESAIKSRLAAYHDGSNYRIQVHIRVVRGRKP